MIRWMKKKFRRLLYGKVILCDTCKYDYGNVCINTDRPNATDCNEYQRKK